MLRMSKRDPRTEVVRERIIERILELAKQKGFSQSALARELGIERQTVSKWVNSREQVPNEANMLELARVLDTSVSYLFGDTDDPRRAPDWHTGQGPSSELEARLEKARERLQEVVELITPVNEDLLNVMSTSAKGSTLYPERASKSSTTREKAQEA